MAAGKTAIIVGAGPAGLTAAYELLTRAGVRPIVLEKSQAMGGLSRTVNFKENRIDIGGHRFFSKSDRVMDWWLKMMPLEDAGKETVIQYHRMTTRLSAGPAVATAEPANGECVMLLRARKSRIYYLRSLFDYPITLSKSTLSKLGLLRTTRIALSYLRSMLFPLKEEKTLEQFLINRFGRELYQTFFKDYTEKVWGVPCSEIGAEWGAQRIKGLSLLKALAHALKKLSPKRAHSNLAQKSSETSLIEQFLYPKYGPGQMWQEVARRVEELGGKILTSYRVEGIEAEDERVRAIRATNLQTGRLETFTGDYFFSTMPVRELIHGLEPAPPPNVQEVAEGLVYRDFITVGLLVSRLKLKEKTPNGERLIRDNWIYVQEPDVLIGRLQIFNNWSPYMVANPDTVWLGLEYFCNDTDPLWSSSDEALLQLGQQELDRIGIIDAADVLDGTVIRMEKTYPAYFGTYDRFAEIRHYVDRFENLFLLGRNGMHRYNNQDHSMLTAMVAVDNILAGETGKANLWDINTEEEYHEEKNG
jgi:protoporphyrinogen oxidase